MGKLTNPNDGTSSLLALFGGGCFFLSSKAERDVLKVTVLETGVDLGKQRLDTAVHLISSHIFSAFLASPLPVPLARQRIHALI